MDVEATRTLQDALGRHRAAQAQARQRQEGIDAGGQAVGTRARALRADHDLVAAAGRARCAALGRAAADLLTEAGVDADAVRRVRGTVVRRRLFRGAVEEPGPVEVAWGWVVRQRRWATQRTVLVTADAGHRGPDAFARRVERSSLVLVLDARAATLGTVHEYLQGPRHPIGLDGLDRDVPGVDPQLGRVRLVLPGDGVPWSAGPDALADVLAAHLEARGLGDRLAALTGPVSVG